MSRQFVLFVLGWTDNVSTKAFQRSETNAIIYFCTVLYFKARTEMKVPYLVLEQNKTFKLLRRD